MLHRNRQTPIPEGVDWSQRATPAQAAHRELGDAVAFDVGMMGRFVKRIEQIRRENKAFLNTRLAKQDGVVRGYHGTSVVAAETIRLQGFRNMDNEEGGNGVSMWDEVAGQEALKFAADRAHKQNEPGNGAVIAVEMTNPQPDRGGRLEWLGQAEQARVLEIYTAEQFLEFLGKSAVSH